MKEIIDTRSKILDVAEELFYKNGYESTPISEILNRTGIAKGTLYHHFKNKEDTLDEAIKRQGDKLFSKARNIAEDKSIAVENRLIMTLMAMQSESAAVEMNLDSIHQPQNTLLHEKINEEGMTTMLVTHDAKVSTASDRILFMRDGQIISEQVLEGLDNKNRMDIVLEKMKSLGI